MPSQLLRVLIAALLFSANSAPDDCPMKDLKWMKESYNYSSPMMLSMIDKWISLAAKDTAILKSKNPDSTNYQFLSEINRLVESSRISNKQYEVSHEFFEAYKKNSGLICTLFALVDSKKIDAKQRTQVLDILLSLIKQYSELSDLENQPPKIIVTRVDTDNRLINFTVTNPLSNNYHLEILEIFLTVNNAYYQASFPKSMSEGEDIRIELGTITISNTEGTRAYNLMPNRSALYDIPPKRSKSFFFQYKEQIRMTVDAKEWDHDFDPMPDPTGGTYKGRLDSKWKLNVGYLDQATNAYAILEAPIKRN